MSYKTIDVGFETVDKILHVADIHIRNYKRHKEYREVFKQLYVEVDNLPTNAIVYVGGDIVHNKTDISPELIELTSEFLKNLADRRHTIMITGNHDANLNNASRMDTLTPIVDTMNHPKLHYLKDSGIYKLADVSFTVFGIFDDPNTFIKASDVTGTTKVAVFHGAVNGSTTDVGYKVSSDNLPITMFDGYDMSMLGDIHKRQFYDEAKTILQVGSLVQQNFGEAFENHGCAIWDVKTRIPKFVDFKNDYGHYTIELEDGVVPNIDNIPKFPRVRLNISNSTKGQIQSAIAEIKQVCMTTDIVTRRVASKEEKETTKRELVKDIHDINYQNNLLDEFICKNHTIDADVISAVKSINIELNKRLLANEAPSGLNWKPMTFQFSNMFSYGSNNKLDMESLNEVVGIFAPNHAGKSAIFDALMFCLFDKCSRTSSARDVLNSRKDKFGCKLSFVVDGITYIIERIGKRKKKKNRETVKVDVNFYMIDDHGTTISLNGEQRRETNQHIQNIVGTYEDFILTSMSVQNNNTGFINQSQSDKKDLLAKYSDVQVLEELYDLGKEEIKAVQALLTSFSTSDYSQLLVDAKERLSTNEKSYKDYQTEKEEYADKLDMLQKAIFANTSKLRTIDVTDTIESLTTSKQTLESNRLLITEKLNKYKSYVEPNNIQIQEAIDTLDKFNIDELNANKKLLDAENKINTKLNSEIAVLKVKIKAKLDTISKLDTHEYDPNCNYCCDNEFVKSAQLAKEGLQHDKIEVTNILQAKSMSDNSIFELSPVVPNLQIYNKANLEKVTFERYQSEIELKMEQCNSKLSSFNNQDGILDLKIQMYHANEKGLLENEVLQTELASLDAKKIECLADNAGIDSDLQTSFGNIQTSKQSIATIEENIKSAHELELRLKAYKYYLSAMHRDGIPYEIIANIIPLVEEDVNDILDQIVDFKLEFNVDGKDILSYINYGTDKWPLEMTSGMEKFLASLAIRVALTNISSMPRPNFLVIDEGFGNLDSANIASLEMLFDYLKTEYDFIMVVSHIDVMKDMVDSQIEINIVDGNSQIIM